MKPIDSTGETTAPGEGGTGPHRGWRAAAEDALYGPDGFFTREDPARHFRTSVHASPLFATAVARLLLRVDEALGHPARLDLVDVGAGRGELLTGVLRALSGTDGTLSALSRTDAGERALSGTNAGERALSATDAGERVRACAVERGPEPPGLDPRIAWRSELPSPGTVTGLVFANEWLDNVPLDVVETGPDGVPRYVLTDPAGNERPGAALRPGPAGDAEWLARWWPLDGTEPGTRAEIGRPRDTAWAGAVRTLDRGLAVAVDYSHTRAARPAFGTLTGYREGREVRPSPDRTCDLTAHVALDACAAAAAAVRPEEGGEVRVLTQREALHGLGLTGARPSLGLASSDPTAYVRALAAAGEAAELTDPGGLGAFGWLLCPAGVPPPLP